MSYQKLFPHPPLKLGLTHQEASKLLLQYGPNATSDLKSNSILEFSKHFWSPVPWMLEITILLELFLEKHTEALVITLFLLLNAYLSFCQEFCANKALLLLKNKPKTQWPLNFLKSLFFYFKIR